MAASNGRRTNYRPPPPTTILTSLLLIITTFLPSFTSSSPPNSLSRGSSLSVGDAADILLSPDNSFTFGFYSVGTNAYTVSIWYSNSANKTIAWTANPGRPVHGRGSRLTFRSEGTVALTDFDGSLIWTTNTTSTQAARVQLLNTGNLVVEDPAGTILWQSFDSPTDTLLPTQSIDKSNKLVDSARGYYSFFFNNNNVLMLIYDGPEISSIYWPNPDFNVWQNGRTVYNSSRRGGLDDLGRFTASDGLAFSASDMGTGIRRRLTLDYDGNLRIYSLNETGGSWSVSWVAIPQLCQVHGLCGRNGICSYTQSRPECSCPPHYTMRDPGDWSKGCQRDFNISCGDPQGIKFVEIPHTDFWGYDLNYTSNVSLRTCKNLCRRDCSCEGVTYKVGSGFCYLKSALFNGKTLTDTASDVYLKLPKSVANSKVSASRAFEPICNASDAGKALGSPDVYGTRRWGTKWVYFYSFVSAVGAIEALFIASGWWFIFRRGREPSSMEKGYRVISSQFRKFTYAELKRITRKFKEELGSGGSGVVYKGVLDDDRVVAVKKLEDAIQGEEFWAEVSVIGRIYHMNLVRMWGFCSEEAHRLLVYEYVENGSLDRCLFSKDGLLGWSQRFKIAVGVARGLAYLHHECLEWIIHCDVKPENILLGSDFEPKIADFGLAKLSQRGGTGPTLKRIRGTRGYMAPEWVSNLPITAMVDVYSFGVVLLELVKGRRVSAWMAGEAEEVDGEPVWSVRMLKERMETGERSWFGDLIDPRLKRQFNYSQAAVMLEIAVSCLEEERSRRPTMDFIVQRLLSCDD